jgi:aminomethyltransferase
MSDVRTSPLDDRHRAVGAKMVEFGGWLMPVAYPTGTLVEHLACRDDAVMFDVSHLGTVRIAGSDAFGLLQANLSNDLGKIAPGRAQYTHLLDDADGSVLDDIIVWWIADDVFDVMPNASNTERVRTLIGGHETTADRAIIAVQGPNAADVGRFRVGVVEWHGVSLTVAGTGYTGEDGVEIAVPIDAAGRLWDALAAAGVRPAGLGARDTLRLEAGLPLHGHELGPGITPHQAGLSWVVSATKPVFRGRQALLDEQLRGISRRLRGLTTDGRRPPRDGATVLLDGVPIGIVTSGNFSPVLEHGIALAFLPPEIDEGTNIEVDVRGSVIAGRVVATPFVRRA